MKFRVWDKALKSMETSPLWSVNSQGKLFYGNADFSDYAAEVLWYTGVKDSQGTEIYEGDILSDPSWWWGHCFVYEHKGEVGACRGDNVSQYLLAKNIVHPMKRASWNLWNGKDVTVIGNIYENPELVGGGQRSLWQD